MQRWQIGVQRELPGRWMAEAGYVGNYGSQIQTSRNLNATPNQYLSTSPTRDQTTINYLGANIPNPFFGLLPTTAAAALQGQNIVRERLLRPYPQFDAVNTTTNEGRSWYNALQLNLQRRFSSGFTVGSTYTYSKATEAIEFLNAGDADPWKGVSAIDVPHRLTVNGIFELPFGRGRRYGADTTAVVDGIIGGWQLSGIYTYQSGFPIGFGNIIFTGNLDDIDLPASERTLTRWFNTDAGFNKVSTAQPGSNVRTFPLRLDNVRSDTVSNFDLSLIKNTSVAGKTLELRFDALNALNHPLFPRAGHHHGPAGGQLRRHGHLGAGELRAPGAALGQVPVLGTRRTSRRVEGRGNSSPRAPRAPGATGPLDKPSLYRQKHYKFDRIAPLPESWLRA